MMMTTYDRLRHSANLMMMTIYDRLPHSVNVMMMTTYDRLRHSANYIQGIHGIQTRPDIHTTHTYKAYTQGIQGELGFIAALLPLVSRP
jgi:hypothetical protein